MRPRPMKPHVACRFCELEKHLLEPWRTAVGEALRKDEAIEAVRMLCFLV
jgi:hypothetical protein